MNEERLKKVRAAIEEGLTQLGYLRIGHAHGPAADELARAVMGFEEAERRLNLAVKADAESQKEAGDTGATDAHSGTPWSLGSAASGSATEDRWKERNRPGTSDGSGHAESDGGPVPCPKDCACRTEVGVYEASRHHTPGGYVVINHGAGVTIKPDPTRK